MVSRKTFVFVLFLLPCLLLHGQEAQRTSSLHDSLRKYLAYFQQQANNDLVRQSVKAAQVLDTTDAISDSLAKKLLIADSLLIENVLTENQKMVVSYAETLVQVLQYLDPQLTHPDYASSLSKLASLYKRMGLFFQAKPLLQQAIFITKNVFGEEHIAYAQNLYDLAIINEHIGQYDSSLSILQQAVAIFRKTLGENNQEYASILSSLALLYYLMGQYEKALPLYQHTATIYEKAFGEEYPDYASCLNDMAGLYKDLGQYEKALPLYQHTATIYEKSLGKSHPFYATSLNNLAVLYEDMGQYEKALLLYQQAGAIDKKALGEEHPDYATHLDNLARLYKKMRQYKKGLPLCQQAAAIYKKALGEEHPDYATCLNNLAGLYEGLGQYEKALPLYQHSAAIDKMTLGKEHPGYATSLNNLGLAYINLNNQRVAETLLIQAVNIRLKHLSRTYTTLSEQEKMVLLKKQSNQFYYLPSLVFTQHINDSLLPMQLYQNELVLKGMALEDQRQVLNAIRKSGDSTALQLYKQWHINKTLIGKQLLLPKAEQLPYLDSLMELTTQLEQILSRQAISFRKQQQFQSIVVYDISQSLKESEAAVEFIRYNLFNKKWTDSALYAALVLLPKDSTAHFIPLFEEKQLQRLLDPAIKARDVFAQYAALKKLYNIKNKHTSGIADTSLYELIWKPLEKYLIGIHTVYYAPAGLLHRIAFSALRRDSSHLLLDNFQLNRMLSTRSIAFQTEITQKAATGAIWGSINYNSGKTIAAPPVISLIKSPATDTTAASFNFYTSDTKASRGDAWNPLAGTIQEIATIKKLLDQAGAATTMDSGMAATEEVFKAYSGNSPQLLHLATHGFFLPVPEKKIKTNSAPGDGRAFTVQHNPMFRSGLVLAGGNDAWKGNTVLPGKEDGILTAYEIAQLDLSGTDLLVLSACETALGDLQGTEGVIGLQRAFKMAGVKQMILSLWRVPDKETTELMTLFYQNWLGGLTTRESLRKAQLKMKERYPPYYWAAFVLVE